MGTIFSYLLATGVLFLLNHFHFLVLPEVLLGTTNPVTMMFIAGGIFFVAQYIVNVIYAWGSLAMIALTSLKGGDAWARALAQVIFYPVFLLIALPVILKLLAFFGVFTLVLSPGSFAIIIGYGLFLAVAFALQTLLIFLVNS